MVSIGGLRRYVRISMEIRDPVHGNIELSDSETIVIDTPEYQRLRQIKQLGFSEVSFPAATHNRYLHSIGVCHIAGLAFDQIFRKFPFSKNEVRIRFRQVLRLAALLHDVGHGPLSHTTEEVMPPLRDLKIDVYKNRQKKGWSPELLQSGNLRADHEDYTIKYITDSELSAVIEKTFKDFLPLHIACLIDKTLLCPDDFFVDRGIDFRPLLSQLVSSELDCDRMDYLERDSYFCGTNYGRFDLPWMVNNMASHEYEGKLYMAINRRALYTFDDFLISRHHMHLMVYFHHKSIIFEEMLYRYLTSTDCSFHLPGDINQYTNYTDYKLYEHLAQHANPWAQRIAKRSPYRMLIELHNTEESPRPENMKTALESQGIDVIWSSSKTRLSKYHTSSPEDRALPMYVVDQYDKWDKPAPIDKSTEIFARYEKARIIDRLYVAPEKYAKAEKFLAEHRI